MEKRIFLIGSCLSLGSEVPQIITTDLKYVLSKAGEKAVFNIAYDFQGEKIAKTMLRQHADLSGRDVLISPNFVSTYGLLLIKNLLEESSVLVLVFGQPLSVVFDWLSAKNQILCKAPIASYPEIESLLARPPRFE